MQKWQSWVKDIAPTPTVILASRAAPPHAAGSQKGAIDTLDCFTKNSQL